MADAMVTARMSQEKKDACNRILEQLGTNPSQVVNQLFDYVIEKQELPFSTGMRHKHTKEEIAEAIAFVDSIPERMTSGAYSTMTAKEAKLDRLKAKGLL